jgi:hypothetical protein
MPDDRLALLLRRFSVAAAAHHKALEALDEARANAQIRIVAGLYETLLREGTIGRERLLVLVDDPTLAVAGMAAVYLLHLYPDRCLAALRRVAGEPGLLGFRAQVAVERWEEGDWTPPGG